MPPVREIPSPGLPHSLAALFLYIPLPLPLLSVRSPPFSWAVLPILWQHKHQVLMTYGPTSAVLSWGPDPYPVDSGTSLARSSCVPSSVTDSDNPGLNPRLTLYPFLSPNSHITPPGRDISSPPTFSSAPASPLVEPPSPLSGPPACSGFASPIHAIRASARAPL